MCQSIRSVFSHSTRPHRSLRQFGVNFAAVLRELDKGERVWISPKYAFANEIYHCLAKELRVELRQLKGSRSERWWTIEHKDADNALSPWLEDFMGWSEETAKEFWLDHKPGMGRVGLRGLY